MRLLDLCFYFLHFWPNVLFTSVEGDAAHKSVKKKKTL